MVAEDCTGALTSAILELAKTIEQLLAERRALVEKIDALEWQAEHYGLRPL
jgi:hypothetical protein